MRLAKFIANSGYCSRRLAGKLVADGMITINGKQVTEFSTIVKTNDEVRVDGKRLFLPELSIWLYNKPPGVITSKKDEENRVTVFQQLPSNLKNFISIGRLDYNSEGLLPFTNNGDLTEFMTRPKNMIKRKYRVKAFGKVNKAKIAEVRKGITVDGVTYGNIEIEVGRSTANNTWFLLTLIEGKNREIRNIMKFLDMKIARLIRVEYGRFKLDNIRLGKAVKAKTQDISYYKKLIDAS